MRDYKVETEKRVAFIRDIVRKASSDGIVFANSGGKDCVLAGILCKMACDDTVGVIMPCMSKRNYGEDKDDAEIAAKQFGIETRIVDLTAARNELARAVGSVSGVTDLALANIAPRLRMAALYSISVSENRLVAGTGNRSEIYMGYFTKWGDGAYDFNPIADLTVTEVYEFLRFFNAPVNIISKPPSAGLFDGQTDEADMNVTYKNIDTFLQGGEIDERDKAVIERYHKATAHKRIPPVVYSEN